VAKFTEVPEDEDDREFYEDNGHYEDETPDFQTIFNAPNYASLITAKQSRKAKEYTAKVNSIFKAATIATLNAGDIPDAAAILHHGPPFSHALGQMADSNKTTAQFIDLITSPSSPVVLAVLTGSALVAQLMRNHEAQLKDIPKNRRQARLQRKAMAGAKKSESPRFTIRFLRWQIPVRFTSRVKVGTLLSGFRSQTKDPGELSGQVFSDEAVVKELEKQGIRLVARAPGT
jgi:hypothetical protein